MKIDWTPSQAIIKKAKKVYDLHQEGVTFEQIGKLLGHGRVYITELNSWYVREILGK